jgi:hypothetical protein
MTGRMPPVPPANRSNKGVPPKNETPRDTSHKKGQPQNTDEQGDTANIKQNTTNAGFFKGRRVKWFSSQVIRESCESMELVLTVVGNKHLARNDAAHTQHPGDIVTAQRNVRVNATTLPHSEPIPPLHLGRLTVGQGARQYHACTCRRS